MSWDVILPLIGVVIGAIITGGLQIHNQERAFQFERKKVKDERALLKLEQLMDALETLRLAFAEKYSAISMCLEGLTEDTPKADISMHQVSTAIGLYAPDLEPLLLNLTNVYARKWRSAWYRLSYSIDEGNVSIEPLYNADMEISAILSQIKSGVVKIAKDKDLV